MVILNVNKRVDAGLEPERVLVEKSAGRIVVEPRPHLLKAVAFFHYSPSADMAEGIVRSFAHRKTLAQGP